MTLRWPVVLAGALAIAALSALVALGLRRESWRAAMPEPRTFSGLAGAHYAAAPLRIGMTRYLPRETLVDEQQPLLHYLADRLKRPVKLYIFDDFVDLSAKLRAGALDLADLPAYAYIRASDEPNPPQLLCTQVTATGSSYEGLVVVRADSTIRTLTELAGRIFCYVGPGSASGFLYPRALFRRAGLDPDRAFATTRFTGTHSAALEALESGACDGAAVFAGLVFREAPEHGVRPETLRVLARTDRIPQDAFCVPGQQHPTLTRQLSAALLAVEPGSAIAARVLERHGRVRGFVAAQDSAYDSVRRIAAYLDSARAAPPE